MNEQDNRVIKTKKAIRDALFSLLAEKPINKISISDIAATAQINRKTFYAHYDCIDDILVELEDEVVESIDTYLNSCMIDEYGLTPAYFLQFINTMYASNPEFYENLTSLRNYNFIVEKLKTLLKKALLKNMVIPKDDQYKAELRLEYIVSGIAAVYVRWLKDSKPCPFEEISQLLLEVIVE